VFDITFECPQCKGPLIVERDHIGHVLECPHCLEGITVPRGKIVNKDRFQEPPGLRRLLGEIRDREWEELRRKHQVAKGRVVQLETELASAWQSLEEKTQALATWEQATAAPSQDSINLRKQVSELAAKFAQANQTFLAGQKQQQSQLEQLRQELVSSQEECQALRKKYDSAAQALHLVAGEVDKARKEITETENLRKELSELRKAKEEAKSEIEKLRAELAESRRPKEGGADKEKVCDLEVVNTSENAVVQEVAEHGKAAKRKSHASAR
jgi:chromosome segregation ATPase